TGERQAAARGGAAGGGDRGRRLDRAQRHDPERGAHRRRCLRRGRSAGDAGRAAAGSGGREPGSGRGGGVRMARTLPWDWYPGSIPDNVVIDESAYVETSFSFHLYRSEEPVGVRIGRAASTYLGTMFDVGRHGRVSLGECALVHGARIICDAA